MPTYVYRFLDSGETIEVQQSFSDEALTEATHPDTGDVRPVKKVFLPVGITFKGSGFYKTDSRGKTTSSTGTATSTTDGESSRSDKSESKTSAKADGGSGGSGAANGSASSSSGSTGSTGSTGSEQSHSHGRGSHSH